MCMLYFSSTDCEDYETTENNTASIVKEMFLSFLISDYRNRDIN